MSSDSKLSFINGLIAGGGAVLAMMSYAFMQFFGGLENVQGVSMTELRVAILLGGIVAAVSIGYEFYNKNKIEPKQKRTEQENVKTNEPQIDQKDLTSNE